jgi:hypothetical protein
MARRIRSAALETRTARLKLPIRKKPHHFTPFAPGISLGYRRCQGPGRWVVRKADGTGGAWIKNVGLADDHEPANGEEVLDYWQAQGLARLSVHPGVHPGEYATVAALANLGDDIEDFLCELHAQHPGASFLADMLDPKGRRGRAPSH